MRLVPLGCLWDAPPDKGDKIKFWNSWSRLFDVLKVAVEASSMASGNPDSVKIQHSNGRRTLGDIAALCRKAASEGNPVRLLLTATYLAPGTPDGRGWHGSVNKMTASKRVALWKKLRTKYADILWAGQDDYEVEVMPAASEPERQSVFSWYAAGAEAVAKSWPSRGPRYVLGGLAGFNEPRSLASYLAAHASARLRKIGSFDYHDYGTEGGAAFDLEHLHRTFRTTMIGEHFNSNNNHPNMMNARYHAAMAAETRQLLFTVPGGQFGVKKWRQQDTRKWSCWNADGKRNRANWDEALACGRALDGTLEGGVILPSNLTLRDVYAMGAMDDEIAAGVPVAHRRGVKGHTVDWQKPIGTPHHGDEMLSSYGDAFSKYKDGTLKTVEERQRQGPDACRPSGPAV